MARSRSSSLIPGFRFHPTDVELVMYYLKRKLLGKKLMGNAIAEVNIYDFSPWDLPDKSSLKSGDLEWYFFCPKAKKYSIGCRTNRTTEIGFWKATGKDRPVKYRERTVAAIKTLVFHLGQAGKGQRTDWVMHEYKMEDLHLANAGVVQDAYVLCKVFEKSGSGPKNGAQYGAPFNEDEWDRDHVDGDRDLVVSHVVASQVGDSNIVDVDDKGKGLATTNMTMTIPGSSAITYYANMSTIPLNFNQTGLSVTEPDSCSSMLPSDDDAMVLSGNDGMFFEELDLLLSSEGVEGVNTKKDVNENGSIYNELVDLIDLDELGEDFKNDGSEYTLDGHLAPDGVEANLGDFFID